MSYKEMGKRDSTHGEGKSTRNFMQKDYAFQA